MALLNIKEVSAWLNLKPATLYAWVVQRKVPALKIQGIIRFRREDIEVWLAGCQIAPPNPSRTVDRNPRTSDIDTVIAAAKAEVYNPARGNPDQDRATRKGAHRGTV